MKKQYDFSQGKRGAVVKNDKEKITIKLDSDLIQWFKERVVGGGSYQDLINDVLRQFVAMEADKKGGGSAK